MAEVTFEHWSITMNRRTWKPLVAAALLASPCLAGCNRQQAASAAPCPGSGRGDGPASAGGADLGVAGPDLRLPRRGDQAAGQRPDPEAALHGRFRREGRPGSLSDRSGSLSSGVGQRHGEPRRRAEGGRPGAGRVGREHRRPQAASGDPDARQDEPPAVREPGQDAVPSPPCSATRP